MFGKLDRLTRRRTHDCYPESSGTYAFLTIQALSINPGNKTNNTNFEQFFFSLIYRQAHDGELNNKFIH